jgi:hypothetical protein
MASPDIFHDPAFIVASVIIGLVMVVGIVIIKRVTADNKAFALFSFFTVGFAAIAVCMSAGFISTGAEYSYPSTKIEANVGAKYEITAVDIRVPGAGSYVIDEKTGNYLSQAWVTRVVNEAITSELYDLVVEPNTGEPTLKLASDAASKTEPSTFLRK